MTNLLCAIPAYNEEKSIRNVIEQIPEKIEGISNTEILVIDDGSTDNTVEISKNAGAKVISHQSNKGVGEAFHTILRYAQDHDIDILVTIDADSQFDPTHIPKLIAPILKNKAYFVTCSRFLDKSLIPVGMSFIKKAGNTMMAKVISFLVGKKITDAACGFRAYSREAFLNLNLFGKFTYTQETLLDLAYKGFEINEVALLVRGKREHGKSHISSNLFLYGIRTLKIIFKTVRDYKPLKVFGILGMLTTLLGFIFEIIPFYSLLKTGSFTPYKFLAFLGGGLIALGIFVGVMGLIADMLKYIRLTQEQILYYAKRNNKKE